MNAEELAQAGLQLCDEIDKAIDEGKLGPAKEIAIKLNMVLAEVDKASPDGPKVWAEGFGSVPASAALVALLRAYLNYSKGRRRPRNSEIDSAGAGASKWRRFSSSENS